MVIFDADDPYLEIVEATVDGIPYSSGDPIGDGT